MQYLRRTRNLKWLAILLTLLMALVLVAGVLAQVFLADTDNGETLDTMPASAYGTTAPGFETQVMFPDENNQPGASLSPQSPEQSLSYYQVAGATLRPRDRTGSINYENQGCVSLASGTGTGLVINTELPIPDGSIIKYLRIYYKDTNASGSVRGYITRYDPGIATVDLVSASSLTSFNSGYGYVVSKEITETVDNHLYAYTLIGWPTSASSTLQVCGLRVMYYAPVIQYTFMPILKR